MTSSITRPEVHPLSSLVPLMYDPIHPRREQMNAGDSDRVSVLREELNSLRVPDADTAAVQ